VFRDEESLGHTSIGKKLIYICE